MRRRLTAALAFCCLAAAFAALADDGGIDGLTAMLAVAETENGAASPYLLPILERLAQAQLLVGALDEAAASRRRALDIAVAAFGCDSASAGEAMAALAEIHIDRRRYLDAEPLLIVAERVLAARVDADHPAMARIFAARARIALARGEPAPAEAWARRAVAVARQNPHGRSAEALRALAAALAAEEHHAAAEQMLAEALGLDRKYHGESAPETARSLSQLGNLRLRQGLAADALPPIEQALAIDQARLGPAHPFIADDLHDLGLVYDALKRPDAARKAFAAAVAVLERGAGRETPRVAYAELELARLDRQHGREAEADAAFRDARRILNKAEAEEHRRERNV